MCGIDGVLFNSSKNNLKIRNSRPALQLSKIFQCIILLAALFIYSSATINQFVLSAMSMF